jgi:hypothetical protein
MGRHPWTAARDTRSRIARLTDADPDYTGSMILSAQPLLVDLSADHAP